MLVDISYIIGAYALARLVNEYLAHDDSDGARLVRGLVSVTAILVIIVMLVSVTSTGNDVSNELAAF